MWARWNNACDMVYIDKRLATDMLLSLATASLPHELSIRIQILLVSAAPNLSKAEEYLELADEGWHNVGTFYACRPETVLELKRDLNELKRRQQEGTLSDSTNVIIEATRRDDEVWTRVDALPPSRGTAQFPDSIPAASTTAALPRRLEVEQDLADFTQRFHDHEYPRIAEDGWTVLSYNDRAPRVIGRIIGSVPDIQLSFRRVDIHGRVYTEDGVIVACALPFLRRVDVEGREYCDESVLVTHGRRASGAGGLGPPTPPPPYARIP